MIRDILDYQGNKIGEMELPDETSELEWSDKLSKYSAPPPQPLSQFEKDVSRYTKRAIAKSKILAQMAAENIGRVRNGTWTVPQLISLTQDAELKQLLANVETLSFEIAASMVPTLSNPLLTSDIKAGWVSMLMQNFFLEG